MNKRNYNGASCSVDERDKNEGRYSGRMFYVALSRRSTYDITENGRPLENFPGNRGGFNELVDYIENEATKTHLILKPVRGMNDAEIRKLKKIKGVTIKS